MTSKTFISPLNDEKISVEIDASYIDVQNALQMSRKVAKAWDSIGYARRGQLLRKVCQKLEARRDEFAQIVRSETGKPLSLAKDEVEAAIEFGYMISSLGRAAIGTVLPSSSTNREVKVRRVPFGVSALLVSYNTPIPNYAWKTFPSLLAGNVVILKPSEFTFQSAIAFTELFKSAGFPNGVFNLLVGGEEIGKQLVNGDIDLISFTGSYSVGVEIERASAGKLRKIILELGGNNPLIVFPDSDFENQMTYAINSAFSNSGQRCASGSRLILHENISQKFIDKFIADSSKLIIGTSTDSQIGPLISKTAAENFENFLNNCLSEGAVVHRVGEKNSNWSSSTVMPAVIHGLDPDSELSKLEIFGPAVRVYTFQTESEAIELANGTPYGLTAAIWTRDGDLSSRVSNSLICGLVNINGPTYGAEFNFPFGGRKQSGNGTQDAGLESINQYSTIKVESNYRSQL